jgi:hypothetical protein
MCCERSTVSATAAWQWGHSWHSPALFASETPVTAM